MKNVFAQNATTEIYDGEEAFLARKLDARRRRAMDDITESVRKQEKKAGLPLWAYLVMMVLFGFGIICLVTFFIVPFTKGGVTYGDAYRNAPWVIWAGVPSLLAGVALFVVDRLLRRKVLQGTAFAQALETVREFVAESYLTLQIPDGADVCDVLAPVYRINKKGERKSAVTLREYELKAWAVFREGDALCFGDASLVMRLPIERLGKLERIEQKATFVGWNKEVPHDRGEYAKYGIRGGLFGLSVQPYLSLHVSGDDEYEILFPPYEAELLESLLAPAGGSESS